MTNQKKPDTTASAEQPKTAEKLSQHTQHREDRRRFMQNAALGAAALTTGALKPFETLANAASHTNASPFAVKPEDEPKFDHVVVLMMENRSFDHMLGRLYSPENPAPYDQPPRGQQFDGLQPTMNNPVSPEYDWLPASIPVSRTTEYETPHDDLVGHQYPDAMMQVGPGDAAHMRGFVNNRVITLGADKKPPVSAVAAPMEGFSPTEQALNTPKPHAAVSVLSTLANSFAVCDNWFSSIPGPTLVNRSFLHAGTSNNWVSNDHNWDDNKNETIFNRLGDGEWNIYNGDGTTECLTYIIHPTITWDPNKGNSIDKFLLDASVGALAKYSFIEPEVIGYDKGHPPDDQHPPRDVRLGENLIRSVYEAVRSSPLWERTLLIVTYDEHGGFFDHVTPPDAVPPHKDDPPGEDGFTFNRLGVRVPAVLISPWIEQGTVYHAPRPIDHTAVIKTL